MSGSPSELVSVVMIFRDADCGAVPVLEDGKPVAVYALIPINFSIQ